MRWTNHLVGVVWLVLFGQSMGLAKDHVLVRGRVVDVKTGEPIPAALFNVNVKDMTKGRSMAAKRTDDGQFEMRLPPGTWDVVVVEGPANEEAKVTYPVVVVAEEMDDHPDVDLGDIQVVMKEKVAGAVRLPDGSPAKGAIVVQPSGMKPPVLVTDENGAFECWPPKADATFKSFYAFLVDAPLTGMATWSLDRPAKLSIPLATEAWWSGRVTDQTTQEPIEGAVVSLESQQIVNVGPRGKQALVVVMDRASLARTNAEGEYRFVGLVAGNRYRTVVQWTGEGQRAKDTKQSDVTEVSSDVVTVFDCQLRRGQPLAEPADELQVEPLQWQVDRWLDDAPPILRDDIQGRVVVLHFFSANASGLGTDAAVLNVLDRELGEASKLGENGIVVIGIATDENADDKLLGKIQSYYGLGYPLAVDTEDQTTARRFDVRGASTVLVIDRDGQSFVNCRTPMEIVLNVRRALLE